MGRLGNGLIKPGTKSDDSSWEDEEIEKGE